jgi:hypothetical protein
VKKPNFHSDECPPNPLGQTGSVEVREDYLHDVRNDPYLESISCSCLDAGYCIECHVVVAKGKFIWSHFYPPAAQSFICPACLRTRDNYIGGEVCLYGEFLTHHKEDILTLIRDTEILENDCHPLQRIIQILDQKESVTITTTYEYLSRRFAERIQSACSGETKIFYPAGESYIQIEWAREPLSM